MSGAEGAVGWASKSNRPEIIAQTVTACYVALDSEKPAPRAVGGKSKPTAVTSIKAGDLHATPAAFWKQAIENERDLANYIGDFQTCVAGGNFPLSDSLYPVTMAMYSALRWYMAHDSRYATQWNVDELNGLFRAFFWRNALATRYDQGFLSQSSTDMRVLKEILFRRAKQQTQTPGRLKLTTICNRRSTCRYQTRCLFNNSSYRPSLPELLDARSLSLSGRNQPKISLTPACRSHTQALSPWNCTISIL